MTAAHAGGCRFCGRQTTTTVDTYKHAWLACESCGNIVRQPKERYLAEKLLPSPVSTWLGSTDVRYVRTFRRFFTDRRVGANPDAMYAYYLRDIERGVENTKYKDQLATYTALLRRYGIELAGRDVVDVSGGPGFLVQGLSKVARRAVMTEYDRSIVDVAREKLGIETLHFDFNAHDIAERLSGEFDFVFIRYAINFCIDVPAFLASLTKRLRPGAHVFVSFVLPTMGACIRWQFDDYAFHVLYNPETMTKMFAEAGFTIVGREEEGSYDYRTGVQALSRVTFPAYELKNRLFSAVGPVLRQDNVIHLYRFDRPPARA